MPGTNVNWPAPLTRLTPWYPGQMGVPGTDSERGLRQHSTGCVFYVDPNAPGTSDRRDGTNPDDPLTTVAAALTKCQPYRGDVIAVMANNGWTYGRPADGYTTPIRENVTVSVPGVRIVGVCPSGSNGVLWRPTDDNQTLITVAALDVLIEGFLFDTATFTGTRAIHAVWDGTTAWGDNTTVRHCTFNAVAIGIQLEYAWYCDIHNNVFHGGHAMDYGIYSDPLDSDSAYNDIHHNQFENVQFAISTPDMDHSFIRSNNIYNSAAQSAALATDEGIDTTGGLQNMVCDNWLSCVLPVADNGDYDDFNTGAATDAWINNHCTNGDSTTTPT